MENNSIFSLTKRILASFLLVSFIFLLLIIRLSYLQLVKGSWLQSKAMDQWCRELPINPIRGTIKDSNGVILAKNQTTYDVYVRPSMVSNNVEVARILSEYLNLDFESVLNKVSNKKVSESLIKMQVEKSIINEIKSSNLKGIVFGENNKRIYPYNDYLTQVLGFTTIDNIGQAGIEAYYDKYLKGTKGYALEESDVNGKKIDNTLTTYIPAISGMNLNLTIDVNIQSFTENALLKLMEEQKPKKASAIVMNPNTGEILSMSTMPNFDLNKIPRDDISKLMETVKNINIVDVYEPGSTFKCITMANSIDLGIANLGEKFFDPGYRMVDGEKIKCWKLAGHGMQSLSEGLCNSCNSVFVDLALRLGKDRMYEMFNKFGLGKPLGIDFLGESGGIIMNYDTSKTVDIARMGFGQAVAVTPIQLISAICSIVNGGNLYRPYFVKNIVDSFGKEILRNNPKILNKTISNKTSEIMQNMMLDVIKKYSGYNAFVAGYEIGGKTGTTQKYEDGRISGKYIASFVGTFPAKNPDYVVLIIVDEPGGESYYGSIAATPYAKQIILDIIKYKNYRPSKDILDDLNKLNNKVKMPNLLGLDMYEAIKILGNLGLQFEVQGDLGMVKNQFPVCETEIPINSMVMIEVDN